MARATWALVLAVLVAPAHARAAAPDLELRSFVVGAQSIDVSVNNTGDAPSHGCYVELVVLDAGGERVDSRRQTLRPLPPRGQQELSFPAEPAFAGRRLQVTVDSSDRIRESDEGNNVSRMMAAKAKPSPKPAPRDPVEPHVDLVAVKVSDDGIEARGIIRNDGPVEFNGDRTATLVRETRGIAHVIETLELATREVPWLQPGQTWTMKVKSPRKVKGAQEYVYRLRLAPADRNAGNDSVSKTSKVVAID